ncbi:hypothetical protein [Arthrobacter sp. 08Y14]|uniref:hypothetical protein n=1 Tax=Arthrobacter sp. 08Y14 TaxID=2058885 RepID=UPI0021575E76|nr:hypothetical protein [Arthrobacter sp. 08Y14]
MLNGAIMAAALMFVSALVWWMRKHPNRAKEHPERLRMPKLTAIFGWICATFGLLTGLWAYSYPQSPLDARIASVGMFVGGLIFVVMYRNFYVAAGKYEVAFRSLLLGREHVLPYSDIADYRLQTAKGHSYLTIKSVHGVKLRLNPSAFNVSPLMKAIDYHRVTGQWPVRAESPRA